mmetsp:Transcript_51905/g.83845  ORF Transcript_51905/g.83845 Transcript_51905/m.83845 type:complete len:121 (+) Transcript_51905:271-633(+)
MPITCSGVEVETSGSCALSKVRLGFSRGSTHATNLNKGATEDASEARGNTRMTDSTENATPPNPAKSRNKNFSVQIQSKKNLNLSLYRAKLRHLSFRIRCILEMKRFQGKLFYLATFLNM